MRSEMNEWMWHMQHASIDNLRNDTAHIIHPHILIHTNMHIPGVTNCVKPASMELHPRTTNATSKNVSRREDSKPHEAQCTYSLERWEHEIETN